ncbi:MAG: hypothetical protein INH41_13300 [Myxococcaceae bacterium]|jgi:hypothetical protein|nr:hypothetical protein [Myxococcaceae bacterium]
MLTLLVNLAFAVMPPEAPRVSLASSPARAATLLTQADLPPPPPLPPDPADATSAVRAEIDDISARLIKLPSRFWPSYSVGLTIAGGVALAVGGIGILLLSWAAMPVELIVVAAVGLVLLVVGVATGVTTVATADAERQRLLERREVLEEQLRTLRGAGREALPPLVELARF